MRRAAAPAVAAVGIALLATTACSRTTQPPVSTNATADSADQVLVQVRTVLTDEGVRRGVLFADTMYVFDENARYELRGVRTEFANGEGALDGTMTAERATYDTRRRVLEGYGDVRIVTEDGRRLTSPHLRYDQERNLVSSDSAFVATLEDNRKQTGVGFEADPQLTRFQCKSNCGGSAPISIPIE